MITKLSKQTSSLRETIQMTLRRTAPLVCVLSLSLSGCFKDIEAPLDAVRAETYLAPSSGHEFHLLGDQATLSFDDHDSVERFYEEDSQSIRIKMSTDPYYSERWLVMTKLNNGELLCAQCAKYNWPSRWVKQSKSLVSIQESFQ